MRDLNIGIKISSKRKEKRITQDLQKIFLQNRLKKSMISVLSIKKGIILVLNFN
ncbi:hypothetical protein [Clostridium felsineum]|uniref:hypothetical protein n=1 Tax=Clostridium felsineum TaxID=36839 RepID=UPI0015904A17|nr:hypothetical protein [Clostridium felsineum]